MRNALGFTFVELAIVIAIFFILLGTATVALGNFMANQALRSSGSTLVQTLREAHARAVASERDSSWGVYFDSAPDPDRGILFMGSGYILRDPVFDQATDLNSNVTFGPLMLNGGAGEVVFAKRSGFTTNDGLFSLVSGDQSHVITINPLGFIDYGL